MAGWSRRHRWLSRTALGLLTALAGACGHERAPGPPPPPVPPPPEEPGALDLRFRRLEVRFESDAGGLSTVVRVVGPRLRVELGPAEERPPGEPLPPAEQAVPALRAALRRLVPAEIDRLEVHDGELVLVDRSAEPEGVLWLRGIELSLENVATRQRLMQGRPTLLTLRATVQRTGTLTAFVTVDPWSPGLAAAGRAAVVGLATSELAPFVRRAAGVRAPQGTLDVFVAFEIQGGRIHGGIKPLLRDLEIAPAGGGPWAWLKAHALDALAAILAGSARTDAVSTVIPLRGELTDPAVQVWPTLLGVLYNSFVAGFTASFRGLPPRTAPEPQDPLRQGYRVLIEGRPPRAQPAGDGARGEAGR